jgi:hypothetical protein
MAEGALGISTGIGQGEAQIIKPFQSPVTAQQYGSVMAAQQKAKADKRSKTLANIETLDFKGMPNEAGLFSKAYNEIVEFVANADLNDPYIDIQMKQKISDLKTRANMSYDRKMAVNNIVGDVQKGEGKNIYLGIDDALQSAVADIDYNTFSNTEAYGKVNAERMSKLSGVKTIPIYDVGAAKASLLNQIGNWAQINKQGRISETPDNVIDSYVEAELMGHPNAYATFEKLMKNDPVGAKAANNQVDKYAFNALKKDLKAKSFTVGSDTNVNVNVGGNDQGTGVSDVAPQTFDMNLENVGGQSPITLSFDADGFTFTPVEASRAVPSNTYTLDGTPYTRQGIVNMSIGSVLDMPVANRDIDVNGRTFKSGQPIPKEYVAFMNQEPNKYRNVINFKKMATALVDGADQVIFDLNEAENLISTNQKWGQKGSIKYKDNQTKLNTKGRFKSEYPALFGGTSQPSVKTTSGKKTKAGAIDLSDF